MSSSKEKTVHVCSYLRKRNGKLEYVVEHHRSMPS